MPAKTYPTVTERYCKKYYKKRENFPSEDICVLALNNRICLITLCPDHKVLKDGPIKSIRYLVETEGKKVSDVHGKKKLDAIKMTTGKHLCEIISGNDTPYIITCAIKGKLIEINDNLIEDIALLQRKPETTGYLAIGLHRYCTEKEFCDYLLTEEQYLNGEVLPSTWDGKKQDGDAEKNGDIKNEKELGLEVEKSISSLEDRSSNTEEANTEIGETLKDKDVDDIEKNKKDSQIHVEESIEEEDKNMAETAVSVENTSADTDGANVEETIEEEDKNMAETAVSVENSSADTDGANVEVEESKNEDVNVNEVAVPEQAEENINADVNDDGSEAEVNEDTKYSLRKRKSTGTRSSPRKKRR